MPLYLLENSSLCNNTKDDCPANYIKIFYKDFYITIWLCYANVFEAFQNTRMTCLGTKPLALRARVFIT